MSGAVAMQTKPAGAAEAYLGQYAGLRRSLPGADRPWLASLRDGAAAVEEEVKEEVLHQWLLEKKQQSSMKKKIRKI